MVAANLGPKYDLATRLRTIERSIFTLATSASSTSGADAFGNVVLSADTASGFGLADPWVPLPTPMDTNVANWPGTASGTLTNISASTGYCQHPTIQLVAVGYAPAGTSGVFQLYVNATAVGTSWTATNASTTTTIQQISVPQTWHGTMSLQIFAQVTGGTGTVRCQVQALYGRQT